MTKVLIHVPNTKSWVGGLNYFINLVEAVNALPEKKIELIVLSYGDELPPPLNTLKKLSYAGAPGPKDNILRRILRRLRRNFQKRDALVDVLLKENIQLFSHGYFLGKGSPVPSLAWIPDFQHKYLPHFFSVKERLNRDLDYKKMVKTSRPILFSSETALSDFNKFYPQHKCPTYVLKFVCKATVAPSLDIMDKILKKYDIHEPFFHVPNQLWAHKNHGVIVEALNILKQAGKCPLVISTGFTEDYRNPNYFPSLQEKVQNYGLDERMRFLGLIEYESMATLMRSSVALINPSLFEGWSTTVEEAKSLGKNIILSNIPVHLEQAPERSQYFSPDDANQLAMRMMEVLDAYDPAQEEKFREKAAQELQQRFIRFGQTYESIVLDIIQNH